MVTEKAMSRELMGKIVDEVFDGAIEDTSVIEEIYAAIKRHEAALSTDAEPVGEIVVYRGALSSLSNGRDLKLHVPIGNLAIGAKLYAVPSAPSTEVNSPTRIELANAINAKIVEVNERLYGKNRADWRMIRTSEIVDAVRSALSTQVQNIAVPEGWQLVPKEPTEGMLFDAWDRAAMANPDNNFYRSVYRDMLAAAPAAKQGEAEPRGALQSEER